MLYLRRAVLNLVGFVGGFVGCLSLQSCMATRPMVLIAKHPPPIEQQCRSDAPELNCPAPWWRWLNAQLHIYYVYRPGEQP